MLLTVRASDLLIAPFYTVGTVRLSVSVRLFNGVSHFVLDKQHVFVRVGYSLFRIAVNLCGLPFLSHRRKTKLVFRVKAVTTVTLRTGSKGQWEHSRLHVEAANRLKRELQNANYNELFIVTPHKSSI